MEINKSFWKNKKVFITGHTGFKGSWLSIWLLEMGAEIYGYSLSTRTDPNLYDILKLNKKMTSFSGDIRDYKKLKKVISRISPDILIHMAAQPLVRDSYNDPVYTYETNVLGTVNVLDVARHVNSIASILVVTSDKCYENIEKNYSYKESDNLGGYDPYSSSKGCAELVASAYYKSFFHQKAIGLATVRAGNVIGGGDWSKDRIIPDAIRAFSNDNDLIIRNPKAIRPWQFVLDPLFGYLLLIEKITEYPEEYSEPWNFGPNIDENYSVKYICDQIVSKWSGKVKWIPENDNKLHESNLLQLNSNKASTRLDWKLNYNINRIINNTINWYINYYDNQNMIDYTLKQIKEFIFYNEKR